MYRVELKAPEEMQAMAQAQKFLMYRVELKAEFSNSASLSESLSS